MSDDKELVVEGMSEREICQLIRGQIAQTYDAMRMQSVWEKILNGTTPSKTIARALVMTLSYGNYQPRELATGTAIHIHVSGADPEMLKEVLSRVTEAPL